MATHQGIRFLSKIYKNLSDQQRNGFVTTRKDTVPVSIQEPTSKKISSNVELEERLRHIESLLEKILMQKRVRVVERDDDDLIARIIDQPLDGSE